MRLEIERKKTAGRSEVRKLTSRRNAVRRLEDDDRVGHQRADGLGDTAHQLKRSEKPSKVL